MYQGPLSGITVVDFSRVLAGPHCGQAFADLGASVIKVEPPMPDVARFSPPSNGRMSGYYAQQNVGKRAISVDLWKPEAREVTQRLCERADVIIENFRPGTLESFGFGYDDIRTYNERVVYVSISGYGQGGPWQSRMAYAPTVEAEVGLTALTHEHHRDQANSSPAKAAQWKTDSLSHGDVYTGLQATVAALAALREAEATGQGQHIDVAMAATLLRINERVHADLHIGPHVGDQSESGRIEMGPSAEPVVLGATVTPFFDAPEGGVVATSTSMVSSLTFPFWIKAMRQPGIAADSRFRTAALRAEHIDELRAIVQDWMLSFRSDADLDAQLDEAKVAFGHVRSINELYETEWAQYWGAFDEVDDRNGSTFTIPGRPWHFSNGQLPEPGTPAWQGEHNNEVLAELNFSAEQIETFTAAGALISAVPKRRTTAPTPTPTPSPAPTQKQKAANS